MQNNKGKSYKLEGRIKLKAPLSHIGESLGVDSYLSTDIIKGANGELFDVFTYSGNSFRGILRDLGSVYFLEKLGSIQLPLQAFYLLFSGGALAGEQTIDIDQARQFRKFIPHLAIFGGGVGNQILPGKINIGSMYPICKECSGVLPGKLREDNLPSWRQLTFEKSYTRMDDAKNDNHRGYLAIPEEEKLPSLSEKIETNDMFETEHKKTIEGNKKDDKKKEKKEAPQQMRYTVELLCAGSELYQRIDLNAVTELELGAFIASLCKFSEKPYIGGKQSIGCGLVDINYKWQSIGMGSQEMQEGQFLSITDEQIWLSKPAEEAKNKYDSFLLDTYITYIEQNREILTKMLGVAA